MARLSSRAPIALACSLCLFRLAAAADDSPAYEFGDKVPLAESDLRAITLQVLATHPLLSSSPGIKYAESHRAGMTMPGGIKFDTADVVFYPHAESAGVKEAFQVQCRREVSSDLWTCDNVDIRRYVRLATQDFEVRVRGNLDHDELLALIEATRVVAQASTTESSVVANTAIIVLAANGGYFVNWGSPDGQGELTVEAHLRTDGNAATADDWQTSILPPE